MNSLYFPNNNDLTNPNLGKVDRTASTQFFFGAPDIRIIFTCKALANEVFPNVFLRVGQ